MLLTLENDVQTWYGADPTLFQKMMLQMFQNKLIKDIIKYKVKNSLLLQIDDLNINVYTKNKNGGGHMPNKIKNILELYKAEIDKLGNEHLVKIILYGSYARGDFHQDSDIDIMILVNDSDDSLSEYENKIDDLTYDFNCKYGTEIMPIVKNVEEFEYWKNVYMFYKNVDQEGVTIQLEKETGTFEDIAQNKMIQAVDDLESAYILLEADKYRAANNRAYYAVFHAIDAVLSIEPVAFKKHKDVIAYFNKNYVNKEIFSKDMGRKISKLEIIRHKSDYDDFYIAIKADTVNQVAIAKEIVQ